MLLLKLMFFVTFRWEWEIKPAWASPGLFEAFFLPPTWSPDGTEPLTGEIWGRGALRVPSQRPMQELGSVTLLPKDCPGTVFPAYGVFQMLPNSNCPAVPANRNQVPCSTTVSPPPNYSAPGCPPPLGCP